jgi:hypothetical protein
MCSGEGPATIYSYLNPSASTARDTMCDELSSRRRMSLSSRIKLEWAVNIFISRSSDSGRSGIGGIEHRSNHSLSYLDQIKMAFASPIPLFKSQSTFQTYRYILNREIIPLMRTENIISPVYDLEKDER